MRLSCKQKLAAVTHFQANTMTHAELARWMKDTFKLEKAPDTSTISKILKQMNKFKNLETETNPFKLNKKSMKETSHPELEDKLFAWFRRNES